MGANGLANHPRCSNGALLRNGTSPTVCVARWTVLCGKTDIGA